MIRTIWLLSFSLLLVPNAAFGQDVLESLKGFLQEYRAEEIQDHDLGGMTLTAQQAQSAQEVLWDYYLERTRRDHAEEWEAKSITLDDHTMKYDYRTFGEKPESGHRLFISMHGGGGAPARVNEQQWRNQIGLYEPEEGIYLAPRAPTDTWNLWHQSHIDPMFTRIIANAIAFADVDPNRVYIMGYSAGGDGTYQLAPRMADQIAAAAMMAGHPNNAQPLGLRNIGFTLHMGGKDAAYKRNEIARQWKKKLADLQAADPDGYQHEVIIHEEHGHWMNRDDAVAVPWMSKFTRNPFPKKVVWFQSGVTHDRFYWLAVDKENRKGGTHLVVSRDGQQFDIEKAEGLTAFTIRLNDQMVDFDKPITVSMGQQELFHGKVERKLGIIANTLIDRGDPVTVYSGEIQVNLKAE